jgi:hypothetical protein
MDSDLEFLARIVDEELTDDMKFEVKVIRSESGEAVGIRAEWNSTEEIVEEEYIRIIEVYENE